MRRFLIAISLLLTTGNVFADDNIKDVLEKIAQNNLTLKALEHENEAQVLDMKAGNVLMGPSVEYSPFFGGGYSGIAESELIVKEDIEFPTKYAARNKQAVLQKETGNQQYLKLRRDILLEAEMLCLDVIRVNQTLAMLHQRLAGSQALRQMYEKRMEAGDANILEVNKVKLDCMEVETMVSEAQNERSRYLEQLKQLNGGIDVDITALHFPEFAMTADFEAFKTAALANDADIQTAEALLRSAEADVNIQKKEWLPNLSVGYRRNTSRNEYVNGVLVGMSFPLVSNGKKVKAARQRQESAILQVEQARQVAESTLKNRYQQLVGLQQVLDHSDVAMMQETLELYSKALQHGEINAITYYGEINLIYEKLQRHIDVHCQSTKLLAELHKNEL